MTDINSNTGRSDDDTRARVYLAGPDVFLPNAAHIGAAKVAIAAEYGLDGVFPLDAELDLKGLPRDEQARRIALANEGLMRSCNAAIANLSPFRGVSMDAGTAYEVGFMRALGKPVLGYTVTNADYAERVRAFRASGAVLAFDIDRPNLIVEDFGLDENLMIAVAVAESGLPICSGADFEAGIAGASAFRACLGFVARLLSPMSGTEL